MKKIVSVVLFILVLVLAGVWLNSQIDIDVCLDRGGRWNHEQEKCELE